MSNPTPRERAFSSLLPVALPIEAALARTNVTVARERRLTSASRAGFNKAQRAALEGMCRFSSATVEIGRTLEGRADVVRVSTDPDELQNIFLWGLSGGLVLRVKHDLSDVVDPGTTRLIEFDVPAAQTAYVTWEVSKFGDIVNVRFACVDEPSWTIPLGQLVAEAKAAAAPAAPYTTGGPAVRSSRQRDDAGVEAKRDVTPR